LGWYVIAHRLRKTLIHTLGAFVVLSQRESVSVPWCCATRHAAVSLSPPGSYRFLQCPTELCVEGLFWRELQQYLPINNSPFIQRHGALLPKIWLPPRSKSINKMWVTWFYTRHILMQAIVCFFGLCCKFPWDVLHLNTHINTSTIKFVD
jgi:hypothetical protein